MRTYPIYLIIALALLSACNKEEYESISLIPDDIEDNRLNLYYPNLGGSARSIKGGDGNYTVTSSDKSVVDVELIQGQTVLFEAKGLGNATVTVSDNSGKSYTFDVHVAYRVTTFQIKELGTSIKGDNLTDEQKKKIEEKALATIPVQIDGGYELIFSNDDVTSGKIMIYAETVCENGQEGTFKLFQSTGDLTILEITYKGEVRKFIMSRNSLTRDTAPEATFLLEDLTKKFKTEYPDVEFVQTHQVIK